MTELRTKDPSDIRTSKERMTSDEACQLIVDLFAWDDQGAIEPKKPYRWETVARLASDYAKAALGRLDNEPRAATSKDQCREQFDMWAENLGLCMDELFMSSTGVPENPFEDQDTKSFYMAWLAAWEACDALNSTPPPSPALPEYTKEIGEAGEKYLKSVSLDGRYQLSGTFRWYELWDAMCNAAGTAQQQQHCRADFQHDGHGESRRIPTPGEGSAP